MSHSHWLAQFNQKIPFSSGNPTDLYNGKLLSIKPTILEIQMKRFVSVSSDQIVEITFGGGPLYGCFPGHAPPCILRHYEKSDRYSRMGSRLG